MQSSTEVAIAKMNADRQMEVDKIIAHNDIWLDRCETFTTAALFIGGAVMTAYKMWKFDTEFVTAGFSSFAAFLAGSHGGRAYP